MNKAIPIWYVALPLFVIAINGHVIRSNWGWWRREDQIEAWLPLVAGLVINVIAIAAALGCAAWINNVIGDNADIEWSLRGKFQMVSMRSFDGARGSAAAGLFIAVGYVEARQFYSYYTVNRDGSFRPNKWTTDKDTAVFEEDRTDGQLVIYDIAFTHGWVNWFATPPARSRGEFHIPQGSLKKAFSLQ